MRVLGGLLALLGTLGAAEAGELVLANGSRIAGELANEVLVVSTGTGLIEVSRSEVQSLTRDEVRLRDGRIVRGTLVGGAIRARTSFGELTVKADELVLYRAAPGPSAGSPSPTPAPAVVTPAIVAPATPAAGTIPEPGGPPQGLPTLASYQPAPPAPPTSVPPVMSPGVPPTGRWLEVTVRATPIYRDAMVGGELARATQGERVGYVDTIDRRLRILNRLVFDGGHWIKVRLADGREGWVPADSVRELP